MFIGILILAVLFLYDWAKVNDEASEGSRVFIRGIATAIAMLFMGRSFFGAVLIGAAWGFAGGVVFMMIRENREAKSSFDSSKSFNNINYKSSPQVQEYLVNGKGEVTNKIFNAWDYSGYTEVERTHEGRILSDASGKIVCTKYVRK